MITVSVIMPTYNHENFIAQAIEGALIQETDFQYEIIVGEDESQDRTREICIDYSRRHPEKIRLFLRSRKDVIYINGRATGRYNFVESLKAARGKYIALCEGDDYWTDPHKLQKQVDFLEGHEEYVICHHDATIIDEKGNIIRDSKLPDNSKRDFSKEELINGAWLLTLTVCFRNVLQDLPAESYKVLNGDMFLFSLLGHYGSSKYLGDDIKPDMYRVHAGGIWSHLSYKEASFNTLGLYYWLGQYYRRIDQKRFSEYYSFRYKRLLLNLLNESINSWDVIREFFSKYGNLVGFRFGYKFSLQVAKIVSYKLNFNVREFLSKYHAKMQIERADKIIIGAGTTNFPGWLATNQAVLDVTHHADFEGYWRPDSRDAFLAEHVWEHLTREDSKKALQNCFEFLKPGGHLRIAVPDGFFPSLDYIEYVKPGGVGAGADDHKVLYSYKSLCGDIKKVGFTAKLLEYWDENGEFHMSSWSSHDGHVRRSRFYDPRNIDGDIVYTSLIVDAIKPTKRLDK